MKAPPAYERGTSVKNLNSGLEDKLGCQLDSARSAASQKRVADTYVPGRGNVVPTVADFAPISVQLEAASTVPEVRSGIRDEGWQKRAGKIGVVQQIEELSAQLQVHSLCNRGGLVDRQVPLLISWAHQSIAPEVPVVASTRNAIQFCQA